MVKLSCNSKKKQFLTMSLLFVVLFGLIFGILYGYLSNGINEKGYVK